MKNNQAFTLIEIVVVVIIVGILASLALPQIGSSLERGRVAEGVEILGSLRGAQLRYFLENNDYATNINDLDIEVEDPAQYFDDIDLYNPGDPVANPIADIDRLNNTYRLSINRNGDITCTNIVAGSCDGLPLP